MGHRTVWSLVFWLLLLGGVYVAATRLDPSRLTGLRQAAQASHASAPVSIRPDAPMGKVAPTERPASVSEPVAADAGTVAATGAPPNLASELPTGSSTAMARAEPGAASTPEPLDAAPALKATPPPSEMIYKCVEGGRVSFSQGVPCAGKAQRVELAAPPARLSGASTP